ncbi:hypothetical protein HDV05_006917, partial [Chytridiales sp. JEL 0842]
AIPEDDEDPDSDISTLGSAMAFLYAVHNLVFLGMSVGLGRYADALISSNRIREAFTVNSGIVVTVASVFIFAGTFIPRGSAQLNPRADDVRCELYDKNLVMNKSGKAVDMEQTLGSDEGFKKVTN